MLLCQHGILIDNTSINIPILHKHLLANSHMGASASAILAPNDCQDVVLMIQLLNSIAQLPELASPTEHPNSCATCQILWLLGQLY